ncbi:MAG: LPS assembly protein LptD [Alphaproteobacteria bacterium]|nr:LPS assembly protein LptD [Alphaproteobacteria bacterium]
MALPTILDTIGGAFAARVCALVLFAGATTMGSAACAQSNSGTEIPALVHADEIVVDEDLGLVTAQGNVEIAQGDRLLKADALTYNRRTNTVTATGNVSLLEPTGEVVFAEFVELTDDMREGAIRNLRLIIADQSRFAAVTARRADGSKTVMRRATYTPCEPCRDDPTRAPVWQIRASRITHDQEKKEVVYDNARLEIAGVPVMYTPYFSHPDGTERRKSGFLVPDISTSSRNGTMVAAPYFWALSPTADTTLTPVLISNDRPMLIGEVRERTRAGEYSLDGSFLNTNREGEGFPAWRGHARGMGRFDIDDTWRWGYDLSRASDKTYIDRYRIRQRFRILDQDALQSRLYTEGFRDRGYASLNALAFQGLRPEDDPSLTPTVLPAANYSWFSEPGTVGGRYTFDAAAYSIYRDRGVHSQHTTMIGGWSLPYTTRSGEIYTLTANLQTDMFNVSNLHPGRDSFQPSDDGTSFRAMPEVGLSWRFPLVRQSPTLRTIIEPVVAVYAAPNMGSQRDLPNEDSRGLTFDDTNLFRMNRFTGYDRIDSGQRVVLGANADFAPSTGERLSVFLGQQYRFKSDAALPRGSGADTRLSDLVGRVLFVPYSLVRATYRYQVDSNDRKLLRSVTGLSMGPSALSYGLQHARIDKSVQTTAQRSINQISQSLSSRLSENWRVSGRIVNSLGEDNGILLAGATLIYEDDCFVAGADLTRRNIGRADLPPDTAILFRIGFRNLGDFSLRGL